MVTTSVRPCVRLLVVEQRLHLGHVQHAQPGPERGHGQLVVAGHRKRRLGRGGGLGQAACAGPARRAGAGTAGSAGVGTAGSAGVGRPAAGSARPLRRARLGHRGGLWLGEFGWGGLGWSAGAVAAGSAGAGSAAAGAASVAAGSATAAGGGLAAVVRFSSPSGSSRTFPVLSRLRQRALPEPAAGRAEAAEAACRGNRSRGRPQLGGAGGRGQQQPAGRSSAGAQLAWRRLPARSGGSASWALTLSAASSSWPTPGEHGPQRLRRGFLDAVTDLQAKAW